MSKPIRLTEAWIQKITEEFRTQLGKLKLSDGKINYTKSLTYEEQDDNKAVVLFEPVAYAKMLMVLHTFSKEVAWHGVVERVDDKHFIIKDILVYPQTVTGTTVTTDQENYQTFLMELDEDTFNNLHMQGHSHVNMSTSPSPVDNTFYDSIVSQLGPEDYYIFMIYNKRLEHFINIYDMKSNILYETKDVSVGIHCEEGDLEQFIIDAKDDVVETTYIYTPNSNYGSSTLKTSAADTGAKKNEGKKPDEKSPASKLSQCPGAYGGYGSYGGYDSYAGYAFGGHAYGAYGDDSDDTDYDKEIFGKRQTWFPKQ